MKIVYKGVEFTPEIKSGKVVFAEMPDIRWEICPGWLKTTDYINTDLCCEGQIFCHSINRNGRKMMNLSENDLTRIESLARKAKKSELMEGERFTFHRRFNGNRGFFYAEFADADAAKKYDRFYSMLFDGFDEEKAESCGERFTAKVFQNKKGAWSVDMRSIRKIC